MSKEMKMNPEVHDRINSSFPGKKPHENLGVKKRHACDACTKARSKCPKEQPSCSRCTNGGAEYQYSVDRGWREKPRYKRRPGAKIAHVFCSPRKTLLPKEVPSAEVKHHYAMFATSFWDTTHLMSENHPYGQAQRQNIESLIQRLNSQHRHEYDNEDNLVHAGGFGCYTCFKVLSADHFDIDQSFTGQLCDMCIGCGIKSGWYRALDRFVTRGEDTVWICRCFELQCDLECKDCRSHQNETNDKTVRREGS